MQQIKVFIVGISGKVGKMLCSRANENGAQVVGGIDLVKADGYPTFTSAEQVDTAMDVIIDFSRPETLDDVVYLAKKFNAPVVSATTGLTKEQNQKLNALAKKIPVVQSGNMSVGVNVMNKLVKLATELLGESYDVEIIEKHHNQKVDAPSGTAMMLARSVSDGKKSEPNFVYGREGISKRNENDVTIHAVRGGTIVGEHDVLFCGNDEIVTISHTALSRKIFVDGAFRAAKFLVNASPALYSMNDVLSKK